MMFTPSSLVNLLLFKPPDWKEYRIPSKVFYLRNSFGCNIAVTHITKPGANVTIIFSHGNAEDLNSAYFWMKILSQALDVNVIGYDYTGYGDSEETPGERKCYADIEVVYKYLIESVCLYPEQIVLYGRSVGTGPSCYLATETAKKGRSVAGLILHSPFTSVFRVVTGVDAPSLIGDKFLNMDRIQKVKCPVFVAHGHLDRIVPFSHGLSLFRSIPKKYRARPFFHERMSHNYHGPEVEIALMKALNAYLDYNILARRLWMKKEAVHLPHVPGATLNHFNSLPQIEH